MPLHLLLRRVSLAQTARKLRQKSTARQASLAFFDVTEDEPSALEAWASLGVCMDALGQADPLHLLRP